ncbi:MAG: HAMP domain-containing sensor histidine kinase [Paraglaciecola sp.]|uniref:sensor histidine kinase n=1 Tax=Paraglaciecola sp. TaxID=1920173 RepID=UPI0032999274
MALITSIKHKSSALMVSLTLGLTCIYLSLAVIVGFVVEDMILSKMLNKHVNYIEQYYQKTGTLPTIDLDFIQVYPSAKDVPHRLMNSISAATGDHEIFMPDDTHYHYKKLTLSDNNQAYIVAEVSDLLAVSRHPDIFTVYLIGLLLALMLAVFVAHTFSNQIVDPIINLTTVIKSGYVNQSTEPTQTYQYEIGYLSETLQKAFSDLHLALEREKDFTTDLGHELRTPLTILKNLATLIEQRGFSQNDLTEITKLSHQMENTVSVLLALARSESIDRKHCNLSAFIEQVIMVNTHSEQTLDIAIDVDHKHTLLANPTLLTLLINNLITNAIEHAPQQQLKITLQQNTLTFENITNSDMGSFLLSRGTKNHESKGVGQGLYLVTRIVESCNWRYQLSQNTRSFRFSIFF